MPLTLPADLERYADDFDQMRGPGVYALDLSRPPDVEAAWDETFDVRPPWFERFRDAAKVVYVGGASDVLARLEDHYAGEVRQAALLRVCSIDGLHDVWWFEDADRAFEQESGIALDLQNDRADWYVHQR